MFNASKQAIIGARVIVSAYYIAFAADGVHTQKLSAYFMKIHILTVILCAARRNNPICYSRDSSRFAAEIQIGDKIAEQGDHR